MLYIHHDIEGNYFKAAKAGEHKVQKDILISEIAKMVAVCPQCVIALLNKMGIKTSERASKSALVKSVSNELNKNIAFARALIVEILSKKKNADGSARGVNKATANKLVNGVGVVFGANGSSKNREMAEKELSFMVDAIDVVNGVKSNAGKYIFWTLLIGGVVGGVIYYYKN